MTKVDNRKISPTLSLLCLLQLEPENAEMAGESQLESGSVNLLPPDPTPVENTGHGFALEKAILNGLCRDVQDVVDCVTAYA
jgi:hypothetical protein